MATLKEAVSRIKQVGVQNARLVPSSKDSTKVDIQINQGGCWTTILESVPHNSADDVLRQATSRVLLG